MSSSTDPGSQTFIERCRIQDNGHCGLFVAGPPFTVRSSMITGNTMQTGDGAAGIYADAWCRLHNNTISDNESGAGVFLQSSPSDEALQLHNNIITGNGGAGIDASLVLGPLWTNYNDVWNNSGGNYDNVANPGDRAISEDPRFVGSGDYHLTEGSPCIGAGENSYVPGLDPRDVDGEDRIQQSTVDLGPMKPNGYPSRKDSILPKSVPAVVWVGLRDGSWVVVPPGALSATTTITIEKLENTDENLDAAIYDIGPDGLAFLIPINIYLPYPVDEIPPEADQTETVGLYYDETEGRWVGTGSTLDTARHEVCITTDHFSLFSVAWPGSNARYYEERVAAGDHGEKRVPYYFQGESEWCVYTCVAMYLKAPWDGL